MALTPNPLFLGDSEENGSFSMEILLRCDEEPNTRVPAIAVFHDRSKMPSFFLGQWGSSLIVRRFGPDVDGWGESAVSQSLTRGSTRLITITSNGSRSVFYVDGVREKRLPGWSLASGRESLRGQYLVLGNSPEVANGWSGEISGVALYHRFLSDGEVMKSARSWLEGGEIGRRDGLFLLYTPAKGAWKTVVDRSGNGNDLLVPVHPKFSKRLLASAGPMWKGSSLQDVMINVFGFIPFGFFLCLYGAARTRLPVWLIAAAGTFGGAALSFFIELLQSEIPVRTSSLADLMSNVIGAALGAILFAALGAGMNSPIPQTTGRSTAGYSG